MPNKFVPFSYFSHQPAGIMVIVSHDQEKDYLQN